MRRILLSLLGLVLSAHSAASIITYNWVTVDAAGYQTVPILGSIQLDESAWRSGGLTYLESPICAPGSGCSPVDFTDPDSSVLNIFFFNLSTSYRHGLGLNLGDPLRLDRYDLTFFDSYMAGDIFVDNSQTTVVMSSVGNLWTISYLDSDAGHACGSNTRCAGVTGHWILESNSVPLPSTLYLAVLALLLTAAMGRQRRRKSI